MRLTQRLLALVVAMAGFLAAAPLLAQTGSLPQEHVQGAVTYVSGGIGSDEAEWLRRAAASYPLTLELAAPSGGWRDEYVANAKVEIRDQQGRAVLSMTAEGPLVLVRLPSGRYAVEVAWNGAIKRKTVDIDSGKPQRVVIEFPRENSP